jgi:hypothetical protein
MATAGEKIYEWDRRADAGAAAAAARKLRLPIAHSQGNGCIDELL